MVEKAATLEDVRAEVLTPDRLNTLVFGVFAAVALLIAVVGVAGVLAFSVSGRTREFGIRLAVGSQPRNLVMGVIARRRVDGGDRHCGRRGLWIRAGAPGEQLFRGSAHAGRSADYRFGLVLLAAAVVASILPAARAARVDVMQALRSD